MFRISHTQYPKNPPPHNRDHRLFPSVALSPYVVRFTPEWQPCAGIDRLALNAASYGFNITPLFHLFSSDRIMAVFGEFPCPPRLALSVWLYAEQCAWAVCAGTGAKFWKARLLWFVVSPIHPTNHPPCAAAAAVAHLLFPSFGLITLKLKAYILKWTCCWKGWYFRWFMFYDWGVQRFIVGPDLRMWYSSHSPDEYTISNLC